jgi:hypothetical protein
VRALWKSAVRESTIFRGAAIHATGRPGWYLLPWYLLQSDANERLKTKGEMGRFLLCALLLTASVASGQVRAQGQAPESGTFPEELLEGTASFDVALTVQGDLRGNYGPCG